MRWLPLSELSCPVQPHSCNRQEFRSVWRVLHAISCCCCLHLHIYVVCYQVHCSHTSCITNAYPAIQFEHTRRYVRMRAGGTCHAVGQQTLIFHKIHVFRLLYSFSSCIQIHMYMYIWYACWLLSSHVAVVRCGTCFRCMISWFYLFIFFFFA